jgi:hypothetical protein
MKRKVFYTKLIKCVFILSLTVIVYHFAIRAWMLDWGAPKKIQELNLSADHLTAKQWHTRAILIRSTPEKIWPWIMQLGQERGGFYSYTWLENIFLADMRNIYEIQSTLQQPRMTGDTIWLANKRNYNGKGFQILAEIIPNRSFIMVNGDDFSRIKRGDKAIASWNIYLYPEDAESTWLIARSSGDETLAIRALRYVTFEIPHFIMEQKMLRTIKELAENN